jgi:hypothetical protein
MIMNGPEVIVRHAGVPEVRAGSANIVTGSGNGFGNTIVVDGGRPGVTVVQNARNGIGNRLIVNPDDLLLDLDDLDLGVPLAKPAPVGPAGLPKPGPAAPADPGVVPPTIPPAVAPPAGPAVPPADPMIEPPPAPESPAVPVRTTAAPSYKGKANPFWSKKVWSDAHDCNLYWSAADRAWFRYASEDDTYRPVVGGPDQPVGGV